MLATWMPKNARLRGQALTWLRADLAIWRSELDMDPNKVRHGVQYEMHLWREDPALAGVRSAAALAKLPEAERREWSKLWEEVEEMTKRAGEPK